MLGKPTKRPSLPMPISFQNLLHLLFHPQVPTEHHDTTESGEDESLRVKGEDGRKKISIPAIKTDSGDWVQSVNTAHDPTRTLSPAELKPEHRPALCLDVSEKQLKDLPRSMIKHYQ